MPIHDRFHERGILRGRREVGDEQPTARSQRAEQRGRQYPSDVVVEVVVETGGIGQVEVLEAHRAAQQVANGGGTCRHRIGAVQSLHDIEAVPVLVDRGHRHVARADGATPLDLAEVAAGDRQHPRVWTAGRDRVDLPREDGAPRADALEARRIELVAVEHSTERREGLFRRRRAVDQIHEDGVAGITARLRVGAPRERRLEKKVVKRMLARFFADGLPFVGRQMRAQVAQRVAQLTDAAVNVRAEERLAGDVEDLGAREEANEGGHGHCPCP